MDASPPAPINVFAYTPSPRRNDAAVATPPADGAEKPRTTTTIFVPFGGADVKLIVGGLDSAML
jgi:hypothetical protein